MKLITLLFLLFTFQANAENYMHIRCGDNGYMVCHSPPGNPEKRHLISVDSINALENHVDKHGDIPGKCDNTTYEELKDICGVCDADVDECP